MLREKKIKNMTFDEIITACQNRYCTGCPFANFVTCPIRFIRRFGRDILDESMIPAKTKKNGTTVNEIILDEFEV